MAEPQFSFTVRFERIVEEIKVPIKARRPGGSWLQFDGLWDTGANKTIFSNEAAARLGLTTNNRIDYAEGDTASGKGRYDAHIVDLQLPEGLEFLNIKIAAMESFAEVLIGMDIISTGNCCISNRGGETVMTFERIPGAAR